MLIVRGNQPKYALDAVLDIILSEETYGFRDFPQDYTYGAFTV